MTAIQFKKSEHRLAAVMSSCLSAFVFIASALMLIGSAFVSNTPALAQTPTDSYFDQAKKYFAANDMPRALASFRQFESLKPENIAVHFWIGLILDQTGDSKAAVQEFTTCLNYGKTVGMDCAELRINLGNSLAKLGYGKEPIFDYQRAIEIDTLNPLAYLGLSKCLIDSGDYDGALKAIDRFVALGGRDINVSLIRGLALTGLEQYGPARQQLHLYLNSVAQNNAQSSLRELATKILSEIEIMQ